MAWTVEFDETALRQLGRLDRSTARRITRYLREVAELDNPRSRGKGLTGNLVGFWRFRVGDYRVICEIIDARLIVYALQIEHRSTAYR